MVFLLKSCVNDILFLLGFWWFSLIGFQNEIVFYYLYMLLLTLFSCFWLKYYVFYFNPYLEGFSGLSPWQVKFPVEGLNCGQVQSHWNTTKCSKQFLNWMLGRLPDILASLFCTYQHKPCRYQRTLICTHNCSLYHDFDILHLYGSRGFLQRTHRYLQIKNFSCKNTTIYKENYPLSPFQNHSHTYHIERIAGILLIS